MKTNTKKLTQFAILLAILAIFCFTPLGSIPIGPVVATLAMLPVIITGFVMGVKAGALMGAIAGLFSFIVLSFIYPGPTSFLFTPIYPPGNGWSLVICFVPRILVGVVAALLYKAFSKKCKNGWLCFGVSGALASLVNTVLVLGGSWLFFGEALQGVVGQAVIIFIGLTVLTNGLPEAVVSFFVSVAIGKAIKKANVK